MQDLMPPINTPDSAFHDGDPTTGQLGTIVTALWLNNVQSATRDVQLEIKNVLAKAGIQPDPKKNNQLAEAISQIIGSGNYASTAYVDNGLNKKIDKANISGQKGNDNDKVPSLSLLTTEIGKLQPKGDYATKDEVNKKLDTSGGAVTGPLNVQRLESSRLSGANKQIMSASTNAVYVGNPTDVSEVRLQTNNGNVRVDVGVVSYSVYHEANVRKDHKGYLCGLSSNGEVLLVGENGIGTEVTFKNVPRDSAGWPFGSVGGGQMLSPPNSAAFQAVLCWTKGGTFRLSGRTSNASGAPSDFVEFYSTGNTTVDRNGNLKVSGSDALSDYPVGAPIPWPQSTAPTGYLVCNGQSFNKSTYPFLASAYPSGTLPDLRGEFLRGLDAGRNIDSARTVLSAQGDAIRNITGQFANNGLASYSDAQSEGVGAFTKIKSNIRSNREVDSGGCLYSFDASKVVPTANENRPRNIAFLYIVRAA